MVHFRRISGQKVYLSPLHPEDAELIACWKNDPRLASYWDAEISSSTLAKTRDEVTEMMNHGYDYAVVSIQDESLMGIGSITGVDHLNQSGFLWMAVGDEAHWNNGCGEEAVRLLLDYAFQILNLYNVTLWASAGQREKLDCYKSSGFKEIGRRRELIMAGTDKFDLVYMDILADEFFEIAMTDSSPGTVKE